MTLDPLAIATGGLLTLDPLSMVGAGLLPDAQPVTPILLGRREAIRRIRENDEALLMSIGMV